MTNKDLPSVFAILKKEIRAWQVPIVTQYADKNRDPFKILISTIISLRTKDAVTRDATERLWKLATNPDDMRKLRKAKIAKAIYPAGFYTTKAGTIQQVSQQIVAEYESKVPNDIDKLVAFKGVGRKTANLVVTKGFGKPGICVDIHVHRITNRWGYVKTPTPDKTEMALRKKLPLQYWLIINDILVTYGQNLCAPISPYCSKCRIQKFCAQKEVKSKR